MRAFLFSEARPLRAYFTSSPSRSTRTPLLGSSHPSSVTPLRHEVSTTPSSPDWPVLYRLRRVRLPAQPRPSWMSTAPACQPSSATAVTLGPILTIQTASGLNTRVIARSTDSCRVQAISSSIRFRACTRRVGGRAHRWRQPPRS